MSQSFDIFRMGANGIDPNGGTGRYDQLRARTKHSADPPFDHGIHDHPDNHPQQLDRSAFDGYGRRDRFTDDRERVKGAFSGKGPKNYVRSDERIREDVCEQLTHHPQVDASDIEVTVREGEVTLTGTVDTRMAKRAAEEAGDHVRGVKDVHNQLRVRPQEAGTPYPKP